MDKKYLISVVGPTAIGKTALSIELAKAFNAEVLSCDSRQFYKEMRIGTAVPSQQELETIRHHFIQNRSIFEDYSVGAFEKDSMALLDHYFKNHLVMITAGGSGLYVDAVIKGLDYFPEVDPQIREDLKLELDQEGLESLQDKLKALDPASYNSIDLENKQRLIRALEIAIGTGKPFSQFLGLRKTERNFETIKIGLEADRDIVYTRINQRVDIMLEQGLVEEARNLYQYRDLNALQTVGYRELFNYFDGEISLDKAIEEIKKNTRRFAKRQGTWFRRDPDIAWFDYTTEPDEILNHIKTRFKSS